MEPRATRRRSGAPILERTMSSTSADMATKAAASAASRQADHHPPHMIPPLETPQSPLATSGESLTVESTSQDPGESESMADRVGKGDGDGGGGFETTSKSHQQPPLVTVGRGATIKWSQSSGESAILRGIAETAIAFSFHSVSKGQQSPLATKKQPPGTTSKSGEEIKPVESAEPVELAPEPPVEEEDTTWGGFAWGAVGKKEKKKKKKGKAAAEEIKSVEPAEPVELAPEPPVEEEDTTWGGFAWGAVSKKDKKRKGKAAAEEVKPVEFVGPVQHLQIIAENNQPSPIVTKEQTLGLETYVDRNQGPTTLLPTNPLEVRTYGGTSHKSQATQTHHLPYCFPEDGATVLWNSAYDGLKDQHGSLLANYEQIILRYLPQRENVTQFLERQSIETDIHARQAQMSKVVESWLNHDDHEAKISSDADYTVQEARPLRYIMRDLIQRAPYASLAWAPACLSTETLLRRDSRYEAYASSILYVTSRMEWYISLSGLLLSHGNDKESSTTNAVHQAASLKARLIDLYQAILLFQIQIVCSTVGNYLQSIVGKTSVAPLAPPNNPPQAAIVRLEEALATGLSGHKIETQLREIGTVKDNTQSTGLLDRLHVIHTPLQEQDPDNDGFVDLFCHWATETLQYTRWSSRENVLPCQILWVTGKAGAGKTVLLRAIARKLESEEKKPDSKQTLAFFFPNIQRNSAPETATSIIKSLIWQVLNKQPSLQAHLDNKLASTGQDGFATQNDFYAMSTLLCEIVKHAQSRIYFVINAIEDLCLELDDYADLEAVTHDPYADKWGLNDMLQLIATTSELSNNVKWLVSTGKFKMMSMAVKRHLHPDFCSGLNSVPALVGLDAPLNDNGTHKGAKNNNLETRQLQLDIDSSLNGVRSAADTYAASKVCSMAKRTAYRGNLQTEVTETLKEVSPGNFLWLNMVCDILESSGIPWNACSILKGLKKDVPSMYEEIIASFTKLEPKDKGRCDKILSTAAIAFQPLSLSELANIVHLPPEVDPMIIIVKMCSSFLVVHKDKVYFTHSSARDYLRNEIRKKGNQSLEHSNIVERCLLAMERCLAENKDDPRHPSPIDYAAIYWTRHVSKVDGDHLHRSLGSIHKFLKSYALNWLDLLAVRHLLAQQALDYLRILEVTLSKKILRPHDADVASLFQILRAAIELLAFHLNSGSPMERSPQENLIFCPRAKQILAPEWSLEGLATAPVINRPLWSSSAYVHVLKGHRDWVRDCAYSLDGRLVASASDDGMIILWDAVTGKLQHVLHGFGDNYVYHVTFSPNGHLLAAADNVTIQLWHVSTGILAKTLRPLAGDAEEEKVDGQYPLLINDIAFSPDENALFAATTRSVVVWKFPYDQMSTFELPTIDDRGYRRVQFSSDGQLLAYIALDSGYQSTITVWDVENAKVRYELPGDIVSIAFSPNSRFLALGSDDEAVHIWDASTGASLRVLENNEELARSLSFSPDGLRLACSSGESVRIWKAESPEDVEQFQLEQILVSHDRLVYSISFSPSGDHLISSSKDCSVRICRIDDIESERAEAIETPRAIGQRTHHTQSISFIEFSPSGTRAASASYDGLIVLWDADTGDQLHSLNGHENDIKYLAFSKDGKILVSASTDGTVGVWQTTLGKMIVQLVGHTDWVRCVVISVSGRFVASASDDKTVRVWDIEGAINDSISTANEYDEKQKSLVSESSRELSGFNDYVYCAAFSPDGRYVAAGGDECRILIWDLDRDQPSDQERKKEEACEVLADKEKLGYRVRGLVFAADGETLLSITGSGSVGTWGKQTGTWQCMQAVRFPGWEQQPFRILNTDPRYPGVLLSEVGALTGLLPVSSSSLPSLLPPPPTPLHYPCGLSRQYITWNNLNLIFLPQQYRGSTRGPCSRRVFGRRVAIGCDSGQVLIFKFSDQKSPAL